MKTELHLFEGVGVEIEYMIIDTTDCRVRPVADLLLRDAHDEIVNEWCHDRLCWSNELTQHVIELKTDGPAAGLVGLDRVFHRHVRRINERLAPHGCQLLPGATHPFMDPMTETVLWERGNREIYQAYNTLFDCRGHGWANLQAIHLNLPFHGDDEFFRLHSAIRAVLPFIPALAAASPFQDGRNTGLLDGRMDHYGKNSASMPTMAGMIVPEPVEDCADYQARILQPLYDSLKPHDPQHILQYEWANARGAIARFERDTIEIRVIDSQECPAADIGVAEMISGAVRSFTDAGAQRCRQLNGLPTELLHRQLRACIVSAERAPIVAPEIVAVFRLPATVHTAGDLWRFWAEQTPVDDLYQPVLDIILRQGTLASRLKSGCRQVSEETLRSLCRDLCRCLADNRLYHPAQ